MRNIYIKILKDKAPMLRDHREYEILIMSCMALDLEILDKLLDQKYLNPKMMIETNSGAEMKQNSVSKS